MAKKKRAAKTARNGARTAVSSRRNRIGILNRYGALWTLNTFESPGEARSYIESYWSTFRNGPYDTSKFKFVPVRVTVTVLPSE